MLGEVRCTWDYYSAEGLRLAFIFSFTKVKFNGLAKTSFAPKASVSLVCCISLGKPYQAMALLLAYRRMTFFRSFCVQLI